MADLKNAYGTSGQSITVTLGSLSNTSSRQSAVVDNSTNKFLSAKISVSIASASSSVSASGYCNVYLYDTANSGSPYSGEASGTDASYTGSKNNLLWLGAMDVNANSTTFTKTFDTSGAGPLPEKWGIVIENISGTALAASGSSAIYQGQYLEAA